MKKIIFIFMPFLISANAFSFDVETLKEKTVRAAITRAQIENSSDVKIYIYSLIPEKGIELLSEHKNTAEFYSLFKTYTANILRKERMSAITFMPEEQDNYRPAPFIMTFPDAATDKELPLKGDFHKIEKDGINILFPAYGDVKTGSIKFKDITKGIYKMVLRYKIESGDEDSTPSQLARELHGLTPATQLLILKQKNDTRAGEQVNKINMRNPRMIVFEQEETVGNDVFMVRVFYIAQ